MLLTMLSLMTPNLLWNNNTISFMIFVFFFGWMDSRPTLPLVNDDAIAVVVVDVVVVVVHYALKARFAIK